jgi:Flp pilus assembly protein TadG
MISRLATIYRRFIASTRGVAAIEFAMIMPVLMVIFLGSYDGGRAIAIYMKVRSATYTLDAITNQYTTIQSSDMQAIVGATSVVLAPYSSTPVVVVISQIKINTGGKATVSWSYALNGTPLAQGSTATIPAGLVASGNTCGTYPCYLIFGQVSYTYTPLFGFFGSGGITLADSLYVTPRSSACIFYPPGNVPPC